MRLELPDQTPTDHVQRLHDLANLTRARVESDDSDVAVTAFMLEREVQKPI